MCERQHLPLRHQCVCVCELHTRRISLEMYAIHSSFRVFPLVFFTRSVIEPAPQNSITSCKRNLLLYWTHTHTQTHTCTHTHCNMSAGIQLALQFTRRGAAERISNPLKPLLRLSAKVRVFFLLRNKGM